MSFSLKGKNLSPTRKRLDATVQVKDWLGSTKEVFDLRLVSRVEMADKDITAAIEEAIERKSEAKYKSEQSIWGYLPLKSINGNAYIKQTQFNDDDQS